jgi:hypothetical protein
MRRHVARLSLYLVTLLCGFALWGGVLVVPPPVSAAESPFAGFSGRWSGTGTIRVKSDNKNAVERVRCTATYRQRGTHNIDLQLGCKSDSYNFDLTGEFESDEGGQVNGRWTEQSRSVGGTAIGTARGHTLRLHVESSAFAADIVLSTRGQRQSISLDSHGAGQTVIASITLQRR